MDLPTFGKKQLAFWSVATARNWWGGHFPLGGSSQPFWMACCCQHVHSRESLEREKWEVRVWGQLLCGLAVQQVRSDMRHDICLGVCCMTWFDQLLPLWWEQGACNNLLDWTAWISGSSFSQLRCHLVHWSSRVHIALSRVMLGCCFCLLYMSCR